MGASGQMIEKMLRRQLQRSWGSGEGMEGRPPCQGDDGELWKEDLI